MDWETVIGFEIHAELLSGGRGSEKRPGEYRTTQNWIGGTRPGNAVFVPPPADQVPGCMAALERFLHDQPARTPLLEKAALAHVQFETIHPFLDGNGRLGRLLTTLLLVADGVLREPLLYLSLYLKSRREEYYELLQRVRTDGDWETWVLFFVRGVRETALQAVDTAQDLARLFEQDRDRIRELGRIAGSALRVHHALQQRPVQTIRTAAEVTGLSIPAVTAAMRSLERAGIVREMTGKRRNRVYGYDRYLETLADGTTTPVSDDSGTPDGT